MKRKKRTLFILAVITVALCACAPVKPVADYDALGMCVGLEYQYYSDIYNPAYQIVSRDDGDILLYEIQAGYDSKGTAEILRTAELNKGVLLELTRIIRENDLYRWNDYKNEQEVLRADGSGLHFTAEYENGQALVINANSPFPEGLWDDISPVTEYTEQLF
ncbi:MAG TPA: hypothetical protein DEB31_03130 [Clostridiales bacterium]|nr:hypothetical protein [Clostridiales bacterium]